MNKLVPLFILLFTTILSYSYKTNTYSNDLIYQFEQIERKLNESEVKERGIDILVTEVIDTIDEIDLKKMARSSIFETSYGFRWKMYNVQTGKVVIIKVDNDFQLISVRDSKNV